MCGIVGAVAQRDVAEILVEGLRRLEYRGYDSAGVAILNHEHEIQRCRRMGKVKALADALQEEPLLGGTGIAHTRWATHGQPCEKNAHPHISKTRVAVVHNGIIENYVDLRHRLIADGYVFESDTDTEVIAHLVCKELENTDSLLAAVQSSVKQLTGAYGTVLMDKNHPEKLVVARSGSPLVIGLGIGENFIASDPLALLPVTRQFMFLEEGDVAEITRTHICVMDSSGQKVERAIQESNAIYDSGDKGAYRHFMLKEIYEQPSAIINTLEGRLTSSGVIDETFGTGAGELLSQESHFRSGQRRANCCLWYQLSFGNGI